MENVEVIELEDDIVEFESAEDNAANVANVANVTNVANVANVANVEIGRASCRERV